MFVIKSTLYLSRFIITVLAIVVTLILSHIPRQRTPELLDSFGADKVLHVMAYAAIVGLALHAVKIPLGWKFYVGLLICMATLGWIDEFSQEFVGRTCSVYDWTADIVGSLMAIAVYRIYTWKFDISTDANLQ